MGRTDTERLDFIQKLLDQNEYTGRCVLRRSTTGRGFRLHETDSWGGYDDVRRAIDEFMDRPEGEE